MSFRIKGANAPSGMGVADQSKATYMELQRKKVHRYVIFKIDEKKNEVVVEKTGCPAESYDDFTAALPENDCRYAVYDYDFVTPDNCQKSKIFFFAWYVIISSRTCITEFLSKTGVCTLYRKLYQFLDPVIIAGAIQQSVYVVVKRINENRSPSVSRIRSKMLYATSKDRFRRELEGIHYEIQATDPTEVELEVLKERAY